MGDICYCTENEVFPADLIVISSSIEGGRCFIETASLDGEKNLKFRCCTKETVSWYDSKN